MDLQLSNKLCNTELLLMCLTVALAYVIYVYVYMISEIDEEFLFLLLSIVRASGLVIYLKHCACVHNDSFCTRIVLRIWLLLP